MTLLVPMRGQRTHGCSSRVLFPYTYLFVRLSASTRSPPTYKASDLWGIPQRVYEGEGTAWGWFHLLHSCDKYCNRAKNRLAAGQTYPHTSCTSLPECRTRTERSGVGAFTRGPTPSRWISWQSSTLRKITCSMRKRPWNIPATGWHPGVLQN
jgi:hypothetical protein